ncbi:MAG: hypothetical protein ACAF42_13820 [Limnothrix sp. BL-A-16]|jgi:hypothetical protein
MAEGRVAFLAGCAITGSLAFAVAKGWIAVGAPPSSVPGLSENPNGVPLLEGGGQLPPAPTVTMLPSPPPTAVTAPAARPSAAANGAADAAATPPTGDSTIAKLEERLRKSEDQLKEIQADLREDRKDRERLTAAVDKLSTAVQGQEKNLTSMALDDKLAQIAANRGEQQPPGQWGNGILWALGGMVLTVSSIVMAGVISTMARQNRGSYGAPPHSPQPFHPIRVVPTYLPRARQDQAVRREPGTADFVEYDY